MSCFWGHAWSDWSAIYQTAVKGGGYWDMQKRTCSKCNKIEESVI
jgi:hypothetical protein